MSFFVMSEKVVQTKLRDFLLTSGYEMQVIKPGLMVSLSIYSQRHVRLI